MRRWLLFVATCSPTLYLAFFIAVIVEAEVTGHADGDPDDGLFVSFPVLLGLHLGTILFTFALMAIYLRDVYRNPEVPDDRRVLWAVMLFLGNLAVMPVYWWIYLRPGHETPGAWARDATQAPG